MYECEWSLPEGSAVTALPRQPASHGTVTGVFSVRCQFTPPRLSSYVSHIYYRDIESSANLKQLEAMPRVELRVPPRYPRPRTSALCPYGDQRPHRHRAWYILCFPHRLTSYNSTFDGSDPRASRTLRKDLSSGVFFVQAPIELIMGTACNAMTRSAS